jgi:CubicO group peptidase (beta-lactamase class C family)
MGFGSLLSRRLFAFMTIWLAGCAGGTPVGTAAGDPPIAEDTRAAVLAARADALIDAQVEATGPGIDMRVVKDGQVIYTRRKGLADIAGQVSIGPATAFQIASVAKPMTAVAVMQLVEQKRLSLDDSILKWLPMLPPAWHAMTIRHLLSHRAGLPDCCTNMSPATLAALDGTANAPFVQRHVHDDTLSFSPGASVAYSNTGYVMLAEIVAAASGERFPEYMRDRVFAPAGMTSTWVFGSSPPAGVPLALSHGTSHVTHGITIALTGPFNVFSTADDMLAFSAALRDGRLLSSETLRLMTTDQSGAALARWNANYGFGWFVPAGGSGAMWYAHTGEMDGYMARLHDLGRPGLMIAMVGNGGVPTARLMNALQSVVFEVYGN